MKARFAFSFVFPTVLVTFTGCSPAADPIARGAAHYRAQGCISSYGGIGAEEPDAAGNTGVPDLPISNTPSTNPGGLVVDGQLAPGTNVPYEVECSVTGSDTLFIDATMKGPNISPNSASQQTETSLAVSGTIGPDGTGLGQVSFSTAETLGAVPVQNTTCDLTATPDPLHACSDEACTGTTEPGETGRMWIEFFCPEVRVNTTGMETADCETDGTIVMERCAFRE